MKCDATGCNAELSQEDDEHWCGYDHNRVVNDTVTDYKARLLERLEELNNGEDYTSESYNYASGRTVALSQVRKIIEDATFQIPFQDYERGRRTIPLKDHNK